MSGTTGWDSNVDAGANAVRDAANAARNAISSIDLSGLGNSLSHAISSVTQQLTGRTGEPSPYIVRKPAGIVKTGAGTIGAAAMVVTGFSFGAAGLFLGMLSGVLGGILGVVSVGLLGGGVFLGIRTASDRDMGKMLSDAAFALQRRVAIPVSELAGAVSVPVSKLTRQLRRAIRDGLIPQGHLEGDRGSETLYLTNAAYEEHRRAELEAQRASEQSRRQAADRAAKEGALPEKAKETIAAFDSFASRMRVAQAGITSAGVRADIDDILAKSSQVKEAVRTHPDCAGDLHQFVAYYLPTAAKLAQSYADFDAMGADSPDAQATRAEVEQTLAAVSQALDKVAARIVREDTWDVASDARVMRTMLRQDGLGED